MENILRLKKNTVPIVLIGLQYAGKTTLVNWLKDKRFTRPKTTVGMVVENVKIGDILFNIIDISGQEAFRENLWKSNILTSVGVIFVLDSSDSTSVKNASEWFWKMVDEWLGESYSDKAILFLANKSDLKNSMSIDKIIKNMKLDRMASYQNLSFQFFKTSIRTEENVELAFKWFVSKIKQLREVQLKKFNALIISDIYGNPIYVYDPEEIARDTGMFVGYIKALSGFANEILGEERFKVLKVDENHFFISEYNEHVVLIAVEKEEALAEARRLSILLHEYLKGKKNVLESELNELLSDYV
ncbi:MAG: GTP-binding protein, partial [Candidatus Heimdallarchaeota archaeon]|nr:GTP-binding protein [Candidatus Heimdallarchaeota archaeon]